MPAIPYYSMPLNGKEILSCLKNIFIFRAFDGPDIDRFKRVTAQHLGVKHIVPFPSGRSAFYFTVKNLLREGDEVVMSVFSFPLYVRLFQQQGIKPVFVDVNRDNGLVDEGKIEQAITSKTKAVFVTHLFGNACDMDRIKALTDRRGLYLLEDCAHAFDSTYHGKPVGSFGIGLFSTSPMKVPTTLGGGFVATNDDQLARKLEEDLDHAEGNVFSPKKLLSLLIFTFVYFLNSFPWIFSILTSRLFWYLKTKNPGALRKLFYSELVTTKPFDPFERMRFSNLQAAIGIAQIERHARMINKRRAYAAIYDSYFQDSGYIDVIREKEGTFNNFLYYIIRLNTHADTFLDEAMKRGLYLFREDVWHCQQYPFSPQEKVETPLADELKPVLVRLPNSDLLPEKYIHQAAQIVMDVAQFVLPNTVKQNAPEQEKVHG